MVNSRGIDCQENGKKIVNEIETEKHFTFENN